VYFGLVVAGLAVSLPVHAEDLVRIAQVGLPPYEILTIVRSTGLDPLSRPVRQGSTYVLRAIDPYGEEVRVVVGAQRGQILSVRPVVPVAAPYDVPGPAYGYPPYGDPRYVPAPGYYAPEPQTRYDPRPPAAIPRVMTAPRDTNVAKPAAKTASTPKAAVATKKPEALPAAPAETSASAPAKPEAVTSTAEVKTEKKDAPAPPPSSDVPPVQTLEK
jgi:hypothetical protein